MAVYYDTSNDLSHHGIFGMKWGVRRFQNKDGTRTDAGKKRYSKKEIEKEFEEKLANNENTVRDIKKMGNSITEMANQLGSEYEKAYETAHLTDSSKKEIVEKLRSDFGNGCDDEDLYDMVLDDYISAELQSVVGSKLFSQRTAFDSMQDQYWDKVKNFTGDMVEKYGDAKITDAVGYTGKNVINDLIGRELNTSFNSYVSRHFDDYWVKDTDAYYSAEKRLKKEFGISMDDYNKKYATN